MSKLKINFASREEIQTLNRIGLHLSEQILEYRLANGYFYSAEDLAKVRGISIRHAQNLSEEIDWEIPNSVKQEPTIAQLESNNIRKRYKIFSNVLIFASVSLGLFLVYAFYLVVTDKNIVSVSSRRDGSEPPYYINIKAKSVPSQDGFNENLLLEIKLDENLEVLAEELDVKCLNQLHIELLSHDNGQPTRSQTASYPLSSTCSTDTSNTELTYQFVDDKGYWYGNYPFDSHEVTVNFWVEARSPNNESIYINSGDIEVDIDIPNWSVYAELPESAEAEIDDNTQKTSQLKLELQRHFGTRLLSVILLLGLFVFILALAFVSEIGSALEVSVGILLGLWGVQNILIPPNIKNQTPIHEAIIFLYLFFGWVAFVRFLLIPVWKKATQPN